MNPPESGYPLTWPTGWPRTPHYERGTARWRHNRRQITMGDALDRLQPELERLNASRAILSSNVPLTLRGLPQSGTRQPEDPGAAVYFVLHGKQTVLACDRWNRVEDNVGAIAEHIEAMRAIMRYGVGTLDQAFRGYQQLNSKPEWMTTLQLAPGSTLADAENAYRALAMRYHPDRGGTQQQMAVLNRAIEQARMELKR